jgi:hypothetical protein
MVQPHTQTHLATPPSLAPGTTLSTGAAGDFPQLVRKALRLLLTDDALVERTAVSIERSMRRFKTFNWHFSKQSIFFDFEAKAGRLVAHFASDGLTLPAYLG